MSEVPCMTPPFPGITTEQALQLLAAVVSIATPMVTLALVFLRRSEDRFLKYYVVVTVAVTVIYWFSMKWNDGVAQFAAIKLATILLGAMAIVAVVWRFVLVLNYSARPNSTRAPIGFLNGKSNFIPYFLLICAWVLISLWIILNYTVENLENRIPVLYFYFGLIFFLAICRISWELINHWGKKRILEDVLKKLQQEYKDKKAEIKELRRKAKELEKEVQ